jgi:hypothetical protein
LNFASGFVYFLFQFWTFFTILPTFQERNVKIDASTHVVASTGINLWRQQL